MEVIGGVIQRMLEYVQSIEIWDVVDILTIAFLAYQFIKLVQKTNSSRIIKGVGLVLISLWLSAGRLRLCVEVRQTARKHDAGLRGDGAPL